MKVTVKFCEGHSVKVLYSNDTPSADNVARFIVWRNELSFTKTEISVQNEEKIYTITVQ